MKPERRRRRFYHRYRIALRLSGDHFGRRHVTPGGGGGHLARRTPSTQIGFSGVGQSRRRGLRIIGRVAAVGAVQDLWGCGRRLKLSLFLADTSSLSTTPAPPLIFSDILSEPTICCSLAGYYMPPACMVTYYLNLTALR